MLPLWGAPSSSKAQTSVWKHGQGNPGFSAGRNWRLESRQHPPTRMSTPQPASAVDRGAFGDWRLPIAHLMAFFAQAFEFWTDF